MMAIRACAILCLELVCPLGWSFSAFAEAPAFESQAPLPRILARGVVHYPEAAKRSRSQGRILLSFAIDAGRAAQVVVETAEGGKILADAAVSLLKAMEFEQPTANSPQYRLSVVFELSPCGKIKHFDVPEDARVSVCGSPIGR
jgi:TonB family protein